MSSQCVIEFVVDLLCNIIVQQIAATNRSRWNSGFVMRWSIIPFLVFHFHLKQRRQRKSLAYCVLFAHLTQEMRTT